MKVLATKKYRNRHTANLMIYKKQSECALYRIMNLVLSFY